jgi:ethanolamine utilization protein EutQ
VPAKLYAAGDIRRLSDGKVTSLTLQPGDLITPLARDEAKRLGVEVHEPATSDAPGRGRASPGNDRASEDLESAVRRIVTSLVGGGPPKAAPRPSGSGAVHRVEGRSVTLEPFPFDVGRPEMDVRLRDVVTAGEHGSPMAAGFMSLREGSFPWTLEYAEVEYVIEGELHLGTPRGTVVGLPGDVLYIPTGTRVTFGTPSWVKFLYVTYPADWAGQGSQP